MSKITKIILIFFMSLIVLIGLFLGYLFTQREYEIRKLPDYYQRLAQDCKEKESFSCCMSSVNYMVANDYKIKSESGCLEGFQMSGLECMDSYVWCEPSDEEN